MIELFLGMGMLLGIFALAVVGATAIYFWIECLVALCEERAKAYHHLFFWTPLVVAFIAGSFAVGNAQLHGK